MENKIDKIADRLNSIDVTLVKNTESLEYHIRRTDELQALVEMTTKHVLMVQGFSKIGIGIIGIGAGIAGILKLFFDVGV